MSDMAAAKSTWDELFGGGSSFSDSTVSDHAPVASCSGSARTSEATDRADNWLDTVGLTSNHHDHHTGGGTVVTGSDLSRVFDDAFLDGLVGVRPAQSNDDDAWNSSETTNITSSDHDVSRCRSPFDDLAVFPAEPLHWTTSSSGGVERPRPRAQTAATGVDNPFSVSLHAATAAARSTVQASV